MLAEAKGKTRKKIENICECTVCLSLPLCDIYQCSQGHLVCKDCHDKMVLDKIPRPIHCPTCREKMPNPPFRNRIAEQVTTIILFNKVQF